MNRLERHHHKTPSKTQRHPRHLSESRKGHEGSQVYHPHLPIDHLLHIRRALLQASSHEEVRMLLADQDQLISFITRPYRRRRHSTSTSTPSTRPHSEMLHLDLRIIPTDRFTILTHIMAKASEDAF